MAVLLQSRLIIDGQAMNSWFRNTYWEIMTLVILIITIFWTRSIFRLCKAMLLRPFRYMMLFLHIEISVDGGLMLWIA